MMLFDFHVHIGQYFDDYYTPPRILRTLSLAGIKFFAYSSTSTVVTDDPNFLLEERIAMYELSEGRAKPILWVTHDMLKRSRDLSLYMSEKGGKICGLKIHGDSEKWIPTASDKCFRRVFEIARELGQFVKVHTGEKNEWCNAGNFGHICKIYRDVPVILAHGRPLSPTIYVLMKNPNAYVDTSCKRKATKEEAYIKKEGSFLAIPSKKANKYPHIYKRTMSDSLCFIECSELNLTDIQFWLDYLHDLF